MTHNKSFKLVPKFLLLFVQLANAYIIVKIEAKT
jgi:hypothetical protein